MSDNILENIGHGLKVAAVDVAHVVEAPITWLVRAEKVIATAIQHDPEVKSAILTLVQNAETVIGDVSTAYEEKGFNLTDDAKTLAEAETFFSYFRDTFIPLMEKVYAELKSDVQ